MNQHEMAAGPGVPPGPEMLGMQRGAPAGDGRQASHTAKQGPATPAPSFPEHRPKNRHNQVSKRKRSKRVKCRDLRHAPRLLFSHPGSPPLGLPAPFPDQKWPSCVPWARPSAVTSGQGLPPFYPPFPSSPSAFLPPAAAPSLPAAATQPCWSQLGFGVLEPYTVQGFSLCKHTSSGFLKPARPFVGSDG